MDVAKWTDDLLAELSRQGDEHADDVAARYYEAVGGEPARLFRGIVRAADTTAAESVLRDYYDEAAPLPDWVDEDQLDLGAKFFHEWGLEIGLGLFCFGLPIGYAAARTAHVLDLTARLERTAHRRVFETAQMVLDVTGPKALRAGAQGHVTTRRVRLMHAGIRYLVQHDPRVRQSPEPLRDGTHYWCTQWGMPLSQEHLVGALLTFGHSMLGVLDRLGLTYDADGAEAYLHLWSVVGHLLGIRPDLLPIDRATGDHIDGLLRKRNLAATPAGQRLTATLLRVLDEADPGVAAGQAVGPLPVATMRLLLGDEIADMLAVPHADWTEHLLQDLGPILHFVSIAELHNPAMRGLIRGLSRTIMAGFVRAERGAGRPAFAIPDRLSVAWGRPADGG